MLRLPARLGLPVLAILVAFGGWLSPGAAVALAAPTALLGLFQPIGVTAGDPVDTLRGEYVRVDTDLSSAGLDPLLQFRRYYRSSSRLLTRLGPSWSDTFDIRVVDANDGKGSLWIAWPGLSYGNLGPSPNGTYRLDYDFSITVSGTPAGGRTATDGSGMVWTFDGQGRLISIKDKVGNVVNLSYDSGGRLTAVADSAGRGKLTLQYTPSGQLASVSDNLSATPIASYSYESGIPFLHSVTDSAGNQTTYGYQSVAGSRLLATVTDGHGAVQLTNTYDEQGRVVSQQTAQAAASGQQTAYQYDRSADGSQTTTITEPALPGDPTFHPTEVDRYDAQGRIIHQVVQADSKTTYTVQYSYDAQGNVSVQSADAAYTANPPSTLHQETSGAACQYTLGFKALHDLIPAVVGDCGDNESHGANGDALQHTSKGLLVWRKADNLTAFTDGYWTWINGPGGVAKRLNTQRFPWEANPGGLPVVTQSAT